jgi:hypothetical protein
LCGDCEGGASSEEQECNPETILSITRVHTAYETVKSFFYTTALTSMKNRSFEHEIGTVSSTNQFTVTYCFGE